MKVYRDGKRSYKLLTKSVIVILILRERINNTSYVNKKYYS